MSNKDRGKNYNNWLQRLLGLKTVLDCQKMASDKWQDKPRTGKTEARYEEVYCT